MPLSAARLGSRAGGYCRCACDAQNTDAPRSSAAGAALTALEARTAAVEQRIELIRELRPAVQRNATLADRIEQSERELAGLQARAESSLKASLLEVAETRAATAKQRLTAAEKALATAISAGRAAVGEQPNTRFDRAHFAEFGDFALMFEVVYYVLSPDFGLYMDRQQGINLGIHRRFEEAGIAFAYTTQELILRRGPPLSATGDPAPAAG